MGLNRKNFPSRTIRKARLKNNNHQKNNCLKDWRTIKVNKDFYNQDLEQKKFRGEHDSKVFTLRHLLIRKW